MKLLFGAAPSPWLFGNRMRAIRLQLLFLLLSSTSLVSQAIGTLTFAESEIHIIRGAMVFVAAQGTSIHRGDMVETSSRGLTQLEFGPGTVVALGPSSKLLIFSYLGSGGATQAELVLLSGWLKGEIGSKAGSYQFDTNLLAGMTRQGSLVVRSGGDSSDIYVESGSANIAQVTAGGSASRFRPAKAGEFFSRRAGNNITSAARPAAVFVGSMPTPFQDTLPSHPIKGRAIEVTHGREIEYAQLRPWLLMPSRWRKELVPRFQSRLRDPGFREELAAHVQEYPEWDPVLHPERYPSKKQ